MANFRKVKKAVIPAAGLGTRFLPATKAVPKEMIPIFDIPMIELIVEEAARSGIEDVVIITGRGKGAIEDHFDLNYELDDTLTKRQKNDLLALSKKAAGLCNIVFVRQKAPLGLGHAVLMAAPVIGNEPFAVLLPDEWIDWETPCTQQLANVYERTGLSVVAVMDVPRAEVSKYGIVSGKEIENRTHRIDQLIEKPAPEQSPSTLAMPGRYLLTPEIFDCLRETKPGRGGEIQLTDALQLLAKKQGLLSYTFEGRRYDSGDRLGYIDATLALALKRPEYQSGIKQILKKHLGIAE